MEKIDHGEFGKRVDRISAIFGQLAAHAEQQTLSRCPYKDRWNLCTAQFGCRNQGPVDANRGLQVCSGDDQLNYRSAWDSEAHCEPPS